MVAGAKAVSTEFENPLCYFSYRINVIEEQPLCFDSIEEEQEDAVPKRIGSRVFGDPFEQTVHKSGVPWNRVPLA